jgi:hypothetical protein
MRFTETALHAVLEDNQDVRLDPRKMLALTTMVAALSAISAAAQQPDDVETVKAASNAFYSALSVFDDGSAMGKVWARTPYVTYVGPLSKSIIVGWDAQKQYWNDFSKRFSQRRITPGRGMAVSKYSKKKEVTMKVLEFISTLDESLKIVMHPKTIMDPWRVSHLRSEKFRKAFPDADKYLDAIEATFPLLVPDPVIPAADEYQRKLSFEITEALAKRKSAKDALDNAAKEWDKLTERRGLEKQKAAWGEKMAEMKALGIEYHPDWAAKAK